MKVKSASKKQNPNLFRAGSTGVLAIVAVMLTLALLGGLTVLRNKRRLAADLEMIESWGGGLGDGGVWSAAQARCRVGDHGPARAGGEPGHGGDSGVVEVHGAGDQQAPARVGEGGRRRPRRRRTVRLPLERAESHLGAGSCGL